MPKNLNREEELTEADFPLSKAMQQYKAAGNRALKSSEGPKVARTAQESMRDIERKSKELQLAANRHKARSRKDILEAQKSLEKAKTEPIKIRIKKMAELRAAIERSRAGAADIVKKMRALQSAHKNFGKIQARKMAELREARIAHRLTRSPEQSRSGPRAPAVGGRSQSQGRGVR